MTSQIFANIYLNEFDRLVRHQLRPLAYLRYGDDFLLFCPNLEACDSFRQSAQRYLETELGLSLHVHNDVVVRPQDGLHFLGHRIYGNGIVIEPATEARLINRLSIDNVASYQALHLPKRLQKRLPWLVQENIEKILDADDKIL